MSAHWANAQVRPYAQHLESHHELATDFEAITLDVARLREQSAAECGTMKNINNSVADINKVKDTQITPPVTEPTLWVAGGSYTESWLRSNTDQLFGILAEIALEFLAAVDTARTNAAESGRPPELPRVVSASYTHRHAPVIPVRYEAPPPWRIVVREPPEVVDEEEIAEE